MNLFKLSFTCYVYDLFTTFNQSYRHFLKAVGRNIDLHKPEHRKQLIYWLNKWGCRQFAIDYHEFASNEILSWYKEGHIDLIPHNKKLWELKLHELEEILDVYDKLLERKASYKKKKEDAYPIHVGATGASKILFALRPEVAIPWDEAIRENLQHKGDGESYVNYLKQAKQKIDSLYLSCIKNKIELEAVPKELNRPEATVAQLIGEYFWVTETKQCYPPSPETIQRWAKWSNHTEGNVSTIYDYIDRLKAFVGGYMGVSYKVDIHISNHTAEYTFLDYGYEPHSTETIVFSKDKKQKFLNSLKNFNIFNWDQHYEDLNVLDGTRWVVEIILESGFVFYFTGNNAYPKKWGAFCRAIEKLLEKQFQ